MPAPPRPCAASSPAPDRPLTTVASHVWSSSDSQVLSVDPVTGAVTAHRPGTATITVTSGGVTGTLAITVAG